MEAEGGPSDLPICNKAGRGKRETGNGSLVYKRQSRDFGGGSDARLWVVWMFSTLGLRLPMNATRLTPRIQRTTTTTTTTTTTMRGITAFTCLPGWGIGHVDWSSVGEYHYDTTTRQAGYLVERPFIRFPTLRGTWTCHTLISMFPPPILKKIIDLMSTLTSALFPEIGHFNDTCLHSTASRYISTF